MIRSPLGIVAVAVLLGAATSSVAVAADMARCPPVRHHRHLAAVRHRAPDVVYAQATPRPPVYNYEDNGRYDGADLPGPGARYGQAASWLDGYGTRPVTYPGGYTTNAYGGSAQVWPYGVPPIPPAGGLAVYSPGAYGPGPRIIHIPSGY